MKNFILLLLIAAFTTGISAQELDSLKAIMNKSDEPEKVESPDDDSDMDVIVEDDGEEVNVRMMGTDVVTVIEKGDSTFVRVGDKPLIQVIEQPDSTRIRVGDKEISIVERDDDTDINVYRVDEHDRTRPRRFRGHWAGFEWGLNNFLDDANTISREGEAAFMDLNTGRSWAINLNFAQYSLGFGSSHVGMLTGLGLEYNNYFFDGDNSIAEENDYVVMDTLYGDISKSKLTTSYLRFPLLFEVQFPNVSRAKRVYISAGLIAGIKLGSHTKVVYTDEGGENKDKNKDDFNISPFRYGMTFRIGFGFVNIYGDYYFTPMFVADKGPELHPINIGLSLTF